MVLNNTESCNNDNFSLTLLGGILPSPLLREGGREKSIIFHAGVTDSPFLLLLQLGRGHRALEEEEVSPGGRRKKGKTQVEEGREARNCRKNKGRNVVCSGECGIRQFVEEMYVNF